MVQIDEVIVEFSLKQAFRRMNEIINSVDKLKKVPGNPKIVTKPIVFFSASQLKSCI